MVLTRIASEKVVHRRIAAVEGLAIMRFRDGFLSPGGKRHSVWGSAAMAARSFALGLGGFSSSSNIRA